MAGDARGRTELRLAGGDDGREQLVKLRPLGKLICMEILCYEDQVKKPAEFEDEVAESQVRKMNST